VPGFTACPCCGGSRLSKVSDAPVPRGRRGRRA
jgi:hypothetical protein